MRQMTDTHTGSISMAAATDPENMCIKIFIWDSVSIHTKN